jgi:hypothetical protein
MIFMIIVFNLVRRPDKVFKAIVYRSELKTPRPMARGVMDKSR